MGKKGTFIVPIGCCERYWVPKVPLFVLFGLDLLYAAVGIFLAVCQTEVTCLNRRAGLRLASGGFEDVELLGPPI